MASTIQNGSEATDFNCRHLLNVFEIGRFAPVLSCDCFFAEATLIQETPAAVSANR